MINTYYINTLILENPATFGRCLSQMSKQRQKKAGSYKFPKDRRLSLGAGLLLDYGLRLIGMRERDADISLNPFGKPGIIGAGIEFSLSHAGEYALAAFSKTPVGVDIEQIANCRPELAGSFFTPREQAYISSHAETARPEAFARVWCLKESFSKAVGLGLSLPLDAYEVMPGDGVGGDSESAPNLARLSFFHDAPAGILSAYGANAYYFHEFSLPGYRAAVCGMEDVLSEPLDVTGVIFSSSDS